MWTLVLFLFGATVFVAALGLLSTFFWAKGTSPVTAREQEGVRVLSQVAALGLLRASGKKGMPSWNLTQLGKDCLRDAGMI